MRLSSLVAVSVSLVLALAACDTGSKSTSPAPSNAPAPAPAPSATTSSTASSEGALRLGAPIEDSAQKVALADIAKQPNAYLGKTFATTGTVTAVCQHMGCWMEIKDDASEAHIKMAGHAFFVPKTASGRKARVLAQLVKAEEQKGACEGEGHEGMAAAASGGNGAKGGEKKGCRAEAEAQLGRPLAKLELVAQGVELM
jgi:hypothetical protein